MTDTLTKTFEILQPPKRIARLYDQEIDLTIVPARVSLEFIQFSKKYGSKIKDIEGADAKNAMDQEMLDDMLGIVENITTRSNRVVTSDWLLDNLQMKDIVNFMTFVFEGIHSKDDDKESTGQAGPAKNPN